MAGHDGDVIAGRPIAPESRQVFPASVDDVPGTSPLLGEGLVAQTVGTVHRASGVPRLRKPVRAEKDRLSRLQADARRSELFITKRTGGQSRRIDLASPARLDEKRREMTGVADFDITRDGRFSADESGEMGRQRALAEDPGGAPDELPKKDPHGDERPEHCVEVDHF